MAEPASLSPPYGSFSNFWGFLDELSQRGPAPQVLEPGVYGARNEATRWEIQNALRFFGLIDAAKRPTPVGRSMIEHPDPETLRALIKEHYPAAIELGLEDATPGQLDDVLKVMGTKEGGTLRKARTFFLHAAQKAGITVGPHLRIAPPRATPRRKPRQGRTEPPKADVAPIAQDLKTMYVELLMEKVREQDAPDSELLDRIERALAIAPTVTTSPSIVRTEASEQG